MKGQIFVQNVLAFMASHGENEVPRTEDKPFLPDMSIDLNFEPEPAPEQTELFIAVNVKWPR